jgi:hypothetical protein
LVGEARRYRALAGEQIALLEDATGSRSAHRRFLACLGFRRIAWGQQNMAAQRWAAVLRLNALRIERGWRLMRAGRDREADLPGRRFARLDAVRAPAAI